jgi:hypothetical protein
LVSKDFKSRAFVIGDHENGLTVVITDPVMVAHYSIKELIEGEQNLMKGVEPRTQMAAIIREIIPVLRGVHADKLHLQKDEIEQLEHGTFTLEQERAVQTELDFANTIAQFVNTGSSTILGVDFCIAVDIKPCGIATKARVVSPSQQIANYLDKYGYCSDESEKFVSTHPQVFPVSGLKVDNLEIPAPWVDDDDTPPPDTEASRSSSS